MKYVKQLLLGAFTLGILASFSLAKEKDMNYKMVEAQVSIDASWEDVWSIVGENFDQSYKFNVDAQKTEYLKEVSGMVGSQRRTTNYKGKVIDVEIVKYDAENGSIEWTIFNMNAAPLKAGFSSYTLQRDGDNKIILTQKAGFRMKVALMNPIAKKKFTKLFKTELAGIKHLAETGENISIENRDEIVEKYDAAISIK